MSLRVKASNAIVAQADFFATAFEVMVKELEAKDQIIAKLSEQLKKVSLPPDACQHPTPLTLERAGRGGGYRVVCEQCGRAWDAKKRKP